MMLRVPRGSGRQRGIKGRTEGYIWARKEEGRRGGRGGPYAFFFPPGFGRGSKARDPALQVEVTDDSVRFSLYQIGKRQCRGYRVPGVAGSRGRGCRRGMGEGGAR